MADTWTPISGYTPQDYTDTMVFKMSSETKKVETIMGQALVAGEENSQYIKFVLDRFWDGIDIAGKAFGIEYALAGKYYGTSNAVNAEMSEDKVRFGWIVPVTACCVSGTLFFIIKVESEDYVLKSQIVEVPVYKTIDVGDVVPEPTKEQWYREFASRVESAITEAETALTAAQAAQASAEAAAQNAQTSENNAEAAAAEAQIRYGSPLTASEAALMVEENRVYVYTGSESGYTFGNWYYYDGTQWTSGGVYNGTGINTDTTLTQAGMAADAKATGDEISQIKEDFNELDERVADLEAGGSGGMSKTAVNLLHTILGEGVYGTDQSANIELLYKELSNVKPVSITATLTSRALVGMQYSELTFEITATFDDESTSIVTDGYRVITTGAIHSGSNTVTVRYRGVTTNVTFTAEQVVTHTITYNLTHVSTSNNTTVVVDGAYYSTNLSVPTDYVFDNCVVTMGGVDITSTAYGNMEILITNVTGDVVITAVATEISYMTQFRRTAGAAHSVTYGYSDYFVTQNYRYNYNGINYISEYPAKNNCTLNWEITNTSDTPVSINGTAIGCIPINDYSYETDTNFRMAYCLPVSNVSNTLDAGATIKGTYELRSGFQLTYTVPKTNIDALDVKFSGNYIADDFSDYQHFEIPSAIAYGSYRTVNWYSDNKETLLCAAGSRRFSIVENGINRGQYEAICSLRVTDAEKMSSSDKLLAVGAIADDNTLTEVPYSVGAPRNLQYNKWYKGSILAQDDSMLLFAPPTYNTDIKIDLYIKEVTA